MGKHDEKSHALHIPKNIKFKQPKPPVPTNISPTTPGEPPVGTNAKNHFR